MTPTISSIDIGIIISYFVLVLGIGFWVARSTKTGDDLFLGGRTFGWGLIGLSLFASNISSSTIIGLTGAAYTTGIVDSVYEWMSGIPLIIAAMIFVPLYLNSKLQRFLNIWNGGMIGVRNYSFLGLRFLRQL